MFPSTSEQPRLVLLGGPGVKQESPACSRWGAGPSQDAAGAGDRPVLLLLQLLLELFLLGCQHLQPVLQLAQLGHPLLRGHGRSQV